MKRINSLSDLLMEEMADLLNAENQLINALPKMVQTSKLSALKRILEDHLEVTKVHARRLVDIFNEIGQNPQSVHCNDMKGIIQESENIASYTESDHERDIAIISMMQRIEQFEISRYVTASEHAADLGHTRIVELLEDTINEERTMNLRLSELAQGMINAQASGRRGDV